MISVVVLDCGKKKMAGLSNVFFEIKKDVYIGCVPSRVLDKIISDFKSAATKSNSLVFLRRNKDSVTGWNYKSIGSKKFFNDICCKNNVLF